MRLAAFGAAVCVSALVGLSTWVESLVEAILIFAVFALVFSHRPFVTVLERAPRSLQRGALVIAALWGWSQVHEVIIDSYPFISWRMYGEPPKYQDYSGYRLVGERCTGSPIVLPPSSRATGRRPVLSLALRRAYEESRNTSGDSTRARERMDKLMSAILTQWNGNRPTLQLCALQLQQTSIDVRETAGSARGLYTTVQRYDAR